MKGYFFVNRVCPKFHSFLSSFWAQTSMPKPSRRKKRGPNPGGLYLFQFFKLQGQFDVQPGLALLPGVAAGFLGPEGQVQLRKKELESDAAAEVSLIETSHGSGLCR
jgi:hypothetical protein